YSSQIPKQFYLNQNYPNPFNPSTIIEFGVSNSLFVKLSLYDINGKLISKLIDKKIPAGIYKINFTASENNLSSGLYIYSLNVGKEILTRRMLYLK
ncbi:MAG TPA: T9SS type A sorting domain-containing protein, partial [Ignavibacteria bacterium]|nr:T9SS type A sorting domain-containing protein [Ignavibacteria bacterium]